MIFKESVQNSELTHFNSRLCCTSARYLISWATTETVPAMYCVSCSKSNIVLCIVDWVHPYMKMISTFETYIKPQIIIKAVKKENPLHILLSILGKM